MNIGNGLSLELGKHQKKVDARLNQLQDQNFPQRLWNKDDTLWNQEGEEQIEISKHFMGWLDVADKMLQALPALEEFCQTINQSGYKHVVLLGMGGSSLAPMVFQKAFKASSTGLKMTIVDSTDPQTINKIKNEINIPNTLFILSSKSGSTAEVMAFYEYFFYRVYCVKEERAGENFIAITDEGSPIVELARRKNFRKTFINFSGIGGRFSALSYFGMVPAALMGINVRELLERTLKMVNSCGPTVPVAHNPGIVLGVAIAEMASQGCDKLTYLLPPTLSVFGLWLEQLLAESTGKNGKGILPINGEPLLELNTYGKDRSFLQVEFSGKHNVIQSEKLEKFITLEFPVINILVEDELDLGKEFLLWEIATATAGAVLGINPFDQPNVQENKINTDRLLKELEIKGKLPEMEPALFDGSLHYYTAHKTPNLPGGFAGGKLLMEDFLQFTKPGDYITLQAFLPEEPEVKRSLLQIQQVLQKNLHIAVTNEFGPRYLHSTGQFHKGGPNKGIFIQLICSTYDDIRIPEHNYTFSLFKRAQAIGDWEALIKHNRHVILIDLGTNYIYGLNALKQIIDKADPVTLSESDMELINTPPAFYSNNFTPEMLNTQADELLNQSSTI